MRSPVCSASALLCLLSSGFLLLPLSPAMAGDQSDGYTKPDVQIDRSVLQDLKGYEPPPMFGASAGTGSQSGAGSSVSPKGAKSDAGADRAPSLPSEPSAPPLTRDVAPPDAPTLTAPKAEDLLNHPVANTDVLTVPHTMTPPDADDNASGSELPVPTGSRAAPAPRKSSAMHSTKKPTPSKPVVAKPVAAEHSAKSSSKEPTKALSKAPAKAAQEASKHTPPKAESPAKKTASEDAAASTPAPMQAPRPAEGYKPKTKATMPAVPPVRVDSAALDPLNLPPETSSAPPSASGANAPQLSPGEKIIDQALTSHMAGDKDPALKKAIQNLPDATTKAAPNSGSSSIGASADTKTAAAKGPVPAPATATKAATPEKKPEPTDKFVIEFKEKLTELQPEQKAALDSGVLQKLVSNPGLRLQIHAYASSGNGGQSGARRASLSRGLSIRSYLLEKGIDPSRIDIRALGDNTVDTPLDRADLVFSKQK